MTQDHSTELTQRVREQSRLGRAWTGFVSLLKGMKITMFYFSHPSTVVTQQYPENRETLKLSDRARTQLVFTSDPNGYHKCTACHICEQNCPNASIHVIERPKSASATGRPELDYFIWRLDSCTFCNICVMVCPFTALKMNAKFESSVYDQRLLTYNLTPYAGPAAPALLKVADLEQRKTMMEPRSHYVGPIPLEGTPMAGIPGHYYNDPPAQGPTSQSAEYPPGAMPEEGEQP